MLHNFQPTIHHNYPSFYIDCSPKGIKRCVWFSSSILHEKSFHWEMPSEIQKLVQPVCVVSIKWIPFLLLLPDCHYYLVALGGGWLSCRSFTLGDEDARVHESTNSCMAV
mmetsp:Transcript_6376/g.11355  ORF Transcript_6376/g.11355 Transcript_6376/m.11355 type:complete len:110 (-) Transcript_6376:325-654(-)